MSQNVILKILYVYSSFDVKWAINFGNILTLCLGSPLYVTFGYILGVNINPTIK